MFKRYASQDKECALGADALTEELRNSNFVSSDRKWKEELDNICIWASGDGSNSSFPWNQQADWRYQIEGSWSNNIILFFS